MRISDWSSDVCSSDLYHIAGADRRELGFAVAEPMVEEPVGKAPGMIDRAGTDPALPNQILFIIDAQGCTGDLPRCRPELAPRRWRLDGRQRVGRYSGKTGRAHVCTPVTNAHMVCR